MNNSDSIRFPTPLCGCCGDRLHPEVAHCRTEYGPTCPPCAGHHLPNAIIALNNAHIFGLLVDPKNNHPRTTK